MNPLCHVKAIYLRHSRILHTIISEETHISCVMRLVNAVLANAVSDLIPVIPTYVPLHFPGL